MTISVGNLIVAGGATVDTSEVLSALNKQGLKVWVGTKTQRDALPDNIKNDDKITFLTYDSEEDIYLIVDTIISYSNTCSSVKISTELAKKINSSDVYTKTEVMSLINSKVASALKYRGAVATVAALPSSGQENGDSYYVQADGYMYAWSSDYSDWQALGSATDMTNYYTKTEVDALLADMAVKFQYPTMPTADSTTVGKIIQYTGADTNDYKNGYWYKGVDNGDSTYSWSLHSVGDYYTKSEIDSSIDKRIELTGAIDLNEYYANGKYIARNGTGYTVTNAPSDLPYPSNGFSLEVMSYGASDGNTDAFCTQMLTAYTSETVWVRSRYWGSDWFRWTSWKKLATKDDTAIKYNYTMTGTASLEDDIKTFVTALLALGANTYVGFFNRSGNLGTAGNYSITVYAEEGTSTFASGYITLGAGALGKTEYIVSYYKPAGSSEEWTIKKLITSGDVVIRKDVSLTPTSSIKNDIRALLDMLIAEASGTYAGAFTRTENTSGHYSVSVLNTWNVMGIVSVCGAISEAYRVAKYKSTEQGAYTYQVVKIPAEYYVRNQNVLSDIEAVTLPTIVPYDGELIVVASNGGYATFSINGSQYTVGSLTGLTSTSGLPIKKGDTLQLQALVGTAGFTARYYKLRDYSDR